jgi:hypothetical protein
MNTEPPPTIAAFFHAHNTGQTDNFNELFTDACADLMSEPNFDIPTVLLSYRRFLLFLRSE